jgi:SET family sugar efflux transporter-like MFS transporter
MVGPALGSLVLVAWRFEGLFTAASFLWALFLLGVLRFVPYRARPQMAPGSRTDSVWRTFRRRDILLSFLAFCAVLATVSLNLMNLPLAIIHTLGGNERDFGIVFGIGPVVEVPMMLWFSLLASRGYQLSLIRLGFLLALLYFCGLFLAREVWHVYLLQIVSGTMIAILTNISIVFFQDLLPGQPGLATALYSNAQAVGSLFGVLSFGFIVDSFGHRGVFMTCAGMTFLGLLLIMRYRKAAVA